VKRVIGVTGSIGSGKSYAIEMFKKICKDNKIDATFLDVDSIRRTILDQMNINREELNKKIYDDPKEMEEYKQFINPKIEKYLKEQINKKDGIIFVEWALLLEDKLYDIVDIVFLIYCDRELQIKRLENGDLGKEKIIKRLDLQLTDEQKIEILKNINKEFYTLNTTNNPVLTEYENILKKGGLYE